MDLVLFLNSATRDQLLAYAESHGIPIHSRLSEAILVADIAKANNLPTILPPLDPTKSKANPLHRINTLGGMIGNEIGLDTNNYSKHMNAAQSLYRSLEIPYEYLNTYDPFTYAIVCYENKIPLIPELSVQLGTYWQFQKDFSHGPVTYENYDYHSFEEFLAYNPLDIRAYTVKVLFYQSVPNLLAFVRAHPNSSPYFETYKGLITHIIASIKPKPDEIYDFFSQFHRNAYLDRPDLVKEYVKGLHKENPISFTAISELNLHGVMPVLSIPPLKLEERLMRSMLTVSQDRPALLQVFPEMSSESNAGLLADQFFEMSLIDFNVRPTRQELVQLIEAKNPRLKEVSEFHLKNVTGWGNPNIEEIRNNISTPEFKQLFEPICPNKEDSLSEPIVSPYISYGTFTKFICYNITELELAFAASGGTGVIFRHPDEPYLTFNNRELDQLTNILEHIPGTDGLINLINVNRVPFIAEISNTPEIRGMMIDIFKLLFEAGMYQRLWKGPGNPYPMKTRETRGASLGDVEVLMSPTLYKINEILKKLPPNVKEQLFSLPMINSDMRESSLKFGSFFTRTYAGEECIGFGSATMIYTGYYYLKKLSVVIPNFDIDKFEVKSTHRAQEIRGGLGGYEL